MRYIHRNKTAALIAGSIRLGAMSANATKAQLERLGKFGQHLGLAFQVIDDILDITQTSQQLGKSAGKDLKAEKATYPALLGLSKAKKEAARLTRLAMSELKPLGKRAAALEASPISFWRGRINPNQSILDVFWAGGRLMDYVGFTG